jgi:hypothetical protein
MIVRQATIFTRTTHLGGGLKQRYRSCGRHMMRTLSGQFCFADRVGARQMFCHFYSQAFSYHGKNTLRNVVRSFRQVLHCDRAGLLSIARRFRRSYWLCPWGFAATCATRAVLRDNSGALPRAGSASTRWSGKKPMKCAVRC